MRSAFIFGLLLFLAGGLARADEMRPAYLEVRETAKETFEVVLKVPAAGPSKRQPLYARFPDDCKILTPVSVTSVTRSRFRFPATPS